MRNITYDRLYCALEVAISYDIAFEYGKHIKYDTDLSHVNLFLLPPLALFYVLFPFPIKSNLAFWAKFVVSSCCNLGYQRTNNDFDRDERVLKATLSKYMMQSCN